MQPAAASDLNCTDHCSTDPSGEASQPSPSSSSPLLRSCLFRPIATAVPSKEESAPVIQPRCEGQRLASSRRPCSGVQPTSRTSKTETPWPPAGSDNGLLCICQQPYDGEFMVLCPSCNDWFHPSCIGIAKMDGCRASFVCRTCRKIQGLLMERRGQLADRAAPATPPTPPEEKLQPPPPHALAAAQTAVQRLVAGGATTLTELYRVLERSADIPWAALRPNGRRHWKRDVIRAAYHHLYPDGPPPSSPVTPTSHPPGLKRPRAPASAPPPYPPSPETPPDSPPTGARTRNSTRRARFIGDRRKAESESEVEEEVEGSVHCVCRKTWNGSFMVRCDGCRVWFHPRCIGLARVHCDLPGRFYCPKCTRWK